MKSTYDAEIIVDFLDWWQEIRERKGVCAKKGGALFGKGSRKKNERTNGFYSHLTRLNLID
jgi:hypothetical protein